MEFWLTDSIHSKMTKGFSQLNDDVQLNEWRKNFYTKMFFGDEEFSSYVTSPDLSFALVNKDISETEV